MCLRHLHGVLHGPRQRPSVDDATSGQQTLVLVIEEHAVDSLLSRSLLVIREHLGTGSTNRPQSGAQSPQTNVYFASVHSVFIQVM